MEGTSKQSAANESGIFKWELTEQLQNGLKQTMDQLIKKSIHC